jgi:hypothetical protein
MPRGLLFAAAGFLSAADFALCSRSNTSCAVSAQQLFALDELLRSSCTIEVWCKAELNPFQLDFDEAICPS